MNVLAVAALLAIPLASIAQQPSCYETAIQTPAPFLGNNGELFKLNDGSIWEVSGSYEYLYAYYPAVIVCPDRGRMSVNGKVIYMKRVGDSSSQLPSRPIPKSTVP